MNKTTLLILEIVWIIISILCFIAAIHNSIKTDDNRFFIFVAMGVIAGVMAYVRDKQRRKS